IRQEDPLSHFLFNLMTEALNVALLEATNNNVFLDIHVGNEKVHISHFQLVDDALIIEEWSCTNANNLFRIRTCFQLASGLKVNFNKCKLFGVGVSTVELKSLVSTIDCLASQFSCAYFDFMLVLKCRDPFLEALEYITSLPSRLLRKSLLNLNVLEGNSIGVDVRTLYIEPHAIWCKVIKSIYGPSGGLHDNSNLKVNSGPCSDVVSDKRPTARGSYIVLHIVDDGPLSDDDSLSAFGLQTQNVPDGIISISSSESASESYDQYEDDTYTGAEPGSVPGPRHPKRQVFQDEGLPHSAHLPWRFLVTRPGDIRSENADMSNEKSCEKHDRLPVEGEDSEVGEHSAQRANMPGSGSAHLLTPFEALSSVRFSFRMSRSASRVYKPFSFQCSPFESSVGAFSLLIRVGVAREQSEKTSNWEGDPPGELTVPQTDTGEQVEYTRALERTMSKELGKMTP
ncbi:hypothetical protein Tco_0736296, partial [Tanacetum coccineum]